MDAGTSGIVGVLVSTVYDRLKQGNWPLWVNQLLPLLLALGGALLAPSIQGVAFVPKDVLGTFLTIYGAMQATYVGSKVVATTSTTVAEKVHVLRNGNGPGGFPKLTAANRQLLIDRYVALEGLTPEAAAKKVDDLFASLPSG